MSGNTKAVYKAPGAAGGLSRRGLFIIMAVGAVAALALRLVWFSWASRDYNIFLQPWFNEIAANGGFAAIGRPIGDYLPSYIYILAALTYLPMDSLTAIKLVSFIGDVFLAVYAMRIVLAQTGRRSLGAAAYCLVLLLPTVVLNSGIWGQCDSIYTAALLACVYYMMQNRPTAGMVAFSVAFVFKLQAVFLAPFIFLLFIKGKVRFWQLLLVPAAYLAVILPAALAGRDIVDLLTIYFRLAGSYSALSLGAPNLYAFIDAENTTPFSVAGVIVFVLLMAALFFWLWRTPFKLDAGLMLRFAMLFVVLVPYLLPHMHERYFYPADVFAVLYAFVWPRRWPVPVVVVSASFLVCGIYLFGWGWMDAAYAAIPVLLVLCWLCFDTLRAVRAASIPAAAVPPRQ